VGGEALDYEMTRSKKRYYSLKLALELHQPCKSSERPDYANLELTLIERINLWPLDCGGLCLCTGCTCIRMPLLATL
jgi:hypothetical protein